MNSKLILHFISTAPLDSDATIALYFAPIDLKRFDSKPLPDSFSWLQGNQNIAGVDLNQFIILSGRNYNQPQTFSIDLQDMVLKNGYIPEINVAILFNQTVPILLAPIIRFTSYNTDFNNTLTQIIAKGVYEDIIDLIDITNNPSSPTNYISNGIIEMNITIGVYEHT